MTTRDFGGSPNGVRHPHGGSPSSVGAHFAPELSHLVGPEGSIDSGASGLARTCPKPDWPPQKITPSGLKYRVNRWDGLYVGRRKGADLVYAGKVDHGFDRESAKALRDRLTPLIRQTQPYSKRIAHRGIWVEPKLLAEIEYRAKSAEGKVRHPFFKALREDL